MKFKYKVIKRKSRMSAIINGNSKYAREYIKGDCVYAHGESMGIMVFNTLSAAESFADSWNNGSPFDESKDLIIVRVRPIGRGHTVIWISDDISSKGIDKFYKFCSQGDNETPFAEAPNNTMAYPGVEVLD